MNKLIKRLLKKHLPDQNTQEAIQPLTEAFSDVIEQYEQDRLLLAWWQQRQRQSSQLNNEGVESSTDRFVGQIEVKGIIPSSNEKLFLNISVIARVDAAQGSGTIYTALICWFHMD